ncbi:hypothetical protein HK102_010405 [Quaeritorhiza haematococci]|nr:hypothetical protein HK102_010405 [Quaeritorhiza haematococci]
MEVLRRTNNTFEPFNDFSQSRYADNAKNLENYTKLLKDMKTDLDIVFKRIRNLRAKVAAQHPAQYATVVATVEHPNDDESDD